MSPSRRLTTPANHQTLTLKKVKKICPKKKLVAPVVPNQHAMEIGNGKGDALIFD